MLKHTDRTAIFLLLLTLTGCRNRQADAALTSVDPLLENGKPEDVLKLVLAVAVTITALLLWAVWHYRKRYRSMRIEAEALKDNLEQSLSSLHVMQSTIDDREKERSSMDAIRNIVDNQIRVIHQLIDMSGKLDADSFVAKFNEHMTLSTHQEHDMASYFDHLQVLVNELHHGVLDHAREAAEGGLRDDEVNYLALYCCGFTPMVIMMCLGYTSMGTIYNKKMQLAKKLHVNNLDEFVQSF